jgi:hypothetical protein
MIWITGDTHGDFSRFGSKRFPQAKSMTREDTVIICGDHGGVWDGSPREAYWLNWLEDRPFTTFFVDGNHENFQFLRPHVIHFMRGQVFTLEGRTFFTMGGASSHDVEDGILDPATPDYYERLLRLLGEGRRQYRIVGQSWWPEELPSEEEYAEARRNLDTYGWEADYIITHSPPGGIAEGLGRPRDALTDFLEEVRQRTRYRRWLFGHCHGDQTIDERHLLLWEKIVRVI